MLPSWVMSLEECTKPEKGAKKDSVILLQKHQQYMNNVLAQRWVRSPGHFQMAVPLGNIWSVWQLAVNPSCNCSLLPYPPPPDFCIQSIKLACILPAGESYVLRYVFRTRRQKVVILVFLSWRGNTEFGHLNLGITESPMGDPSISQPYEPAVHDVFTPAVRICCIYVL